MRAAILSIGSELTQGFLTDTNATFLSQELNALGVEVTGAFQVGDVLDRIIRAFQRAREDAEIVVATGGIGPTDDDLTREAVAAIVGEEPVVDPELAEGIRRYFNLRGIVMPEQNVKQAWVIPSCEPLPNPLGTAPGWFVRHGEGRIVLMPGVPREMKRMWAEQAVPRLLPLLDGRAIVSTTLKTIGIGESALEDKVRDLVRRGDPIVATYAKDDGVHVRLTAVRDTAEDAQAVVDATAAIVRERLAGFVYGDLEISLADAILAPIARSGGRLALWEAGNAGRLRHVLEEAADAEEIIVEARTTPYHTGASFAASGDVEAVARVCAETIALQAGASHGASVCVRLTPGDTPDRTRGEVGLALAWPGGLASRQHQVVAIPHEIRRRATMWACDFLWSTLRDATARHTG